MELDDDLASAAATGDPASLIPYVAAYFDLPNSFGAFLICTSLGCIMLGLTIHQTYRYFRFYPKDTLSLKVLVLLVLTLDILHSATSIHVCYYYLVSNYFRPIRLLDGVWSIRLIVLEMGLLIVVAHCFYARRLFLLANHNVIPALIIGLLLTAELALCIAVTVKSYQSITFWGIEHYSWLMWAILTVAVAADIVATTALTYYLRKSRTGTDSIVDILMIYTINTGLSTSLITLAALVCAIVMPRNLVYSAILVVGTKMYANSLLAVMNSRRGVLDKGMAAYDTGSFGLQFIDAQDLPAPAPQGEQHELREIRFRLPGRPRRQEPAQESGNRSDPVLHLKAASGSSVSLAQMARERD
ncbi:hypothetical protein C8Q77DRAFT_1155947 [Trametes polyzona]|nr:hypothetical protein C8Q77DRAFT_1155947 [Trametes polyzona]